MDLSEISAIGVDEIHWSAKRGFMTLVYQIDNHCKRLLWCGEDRTEKTITAFFDWFGEERSAKLLFVCSDMWKPYLKLIALRAKSALNILDRFHIAKKLGDAIDDVRVAETKELMRQGKNVLLKYSRWCFLKNPENLTENQKVKLRDLLKCNLKTIRAYLLKEDFQAFWDYVSPLWAGKFLDQWCSQVMRSRLEPMKKVAKTIRAHKQLTSGPGTRPRISLTKEFESQEFRTRPIPSDTIKGPIQLSNACRTQRSRFDQQPSNRLKHLWQNFSR
jgi:transposase